MRALTLTACLALPLLACGAPAGSPPAAATTVTGVVVGAPCRPVERAGDPPCPPAAGVTVTFGRTAARTDAAGRYSIALEPGTYPIQVGAGGWQRPADPAAVTVRGGGTLTLDLRYDTGIR